MESESENKPSEKKAFKLLQLVAYGKPDWYADEVMFPHQLAVYFDAIEKFKNEPTDENRTAMENAKLRYHEHQIDLRWRMGFIKSKDGYDPKNFERDFKSDDVSFTDEGIVLHDPSFPKESFGLRIANRAFNWICSLIYSY